MSQHLIFICFLRLFHTYLSPLFSSASATAYKAPANLRCVARAGCRRCLRVQNPPNPSQTPIRSYNFYPPALLPYLCSQLQAATTHLTPNGQEAKRSPPVARRGGSTAAGVLTGQHPGGKHAAGRRAPIQCSSTSLPIESTSTVISTDCQALLLALCVGRWQAWCPTASWSCCCSCLPNCLLPTPLLIMRVSRPGR